jgi:hypothetical protein
MDNITATNWWQPSCPKNMLPGVLVREADRWLLRLDGHFEQNGNIQSEGSSPNSFSILIGSTSKGRPISLIGCQVVKMSMPFGGTRGELTVLPSLLIYGVHVARPDDLVLTSLSVRYSNLDAWVEVSGFLIKVGDQPPYSVDLKYSKPDPIEAALSDEMRLTIDFSVAGPSLTTITTEVSITQTSWLTITSTKGLTFERILKHVASFADFIAIAVGESLTPMEMFAICNSRDGSGALVSAEIELIHNRKALASASSDILPWDMLFTLREIRGRFSQLMRKSPSIYVEHRFLNLFQALESYHRRTVTPSPESVQARQKIVDRILNAVSQEDKKWLKKKLKSMEGPAAEERIGDVVSELKADWLLSKEDIALAATLRNFYTHFDPKVEERLPPIHIRFRIMHNLAVRLRVLCEMILLNRAGFSSDEMKERMARIARVERHLVKIGSKE